MKKEFSYKIEYETDKKTGQIVATIPELKQINLVEAKPQPSLCLQGFCELFIFFAPFLIQHLVLNSWRTELWIN